MVGIMEGEMDTESISKSQESKGYLEHNKD